MVSVINKAYAKAGAHIEDVEDNVGKLALLVGSNHGISEALIAMVWDGISHAFKMVVECKMGVDQLQTMIVKFCQEITKCKEKKWNLEAMMLQNYATSTAQEEVNQLRLI